MTAGELPAPFVETPCVRNSALAIEVPRRSVTRRPGLARLFRLRVLATVVTAALLSGCGGDSPTETTCLRVGGTWKTNLRDTCGVDVWEVLSISQDACHFAGASSLAPISFEGDVSDKSVTIRFTYSGTCPGTATGTGTITFDGIVGTFSGQRAGGTGCCSGPFGGSFSFLPPL